MKLHRYKNYKEYRDIQNRANLRKINNVWVQPETVETICLILKDLISEFTFGLCHGTRRGVEQQLFSDALGCDVLGTEIADTATDFPNTIQWDFHVVKSDWLGSCDFVYSNSLDHAIDPHKALAAWLSCLKPGGVLVVEWTHAVGKRRKKANKVDPFFARAQKVRALIEDAGGEIINTLKTSNKKSSDITLIFARREQG